MNPTDDSLMTYEEAGKLVGMGPTFIKNAIKDGRLVGTDLGHRCKRVSRFAMQKFINESQTRDRSHRRQFE